MEKLWCSKHQSGSSKSSGGYISANMANGQLKNNKNNAMINQLQW